VSEKAPRTIRIKLVRSGIGFPYRQKDVVRSLGLRRLNQVVERPDTPQIRGLVAKVSHLVAIVGDSPAPAWASLPEYTLHPREVAPSGAAPAPAGETLVAVEAASPEVEPVPVHEKAEEAVEAAAPAKVAKERKPAGRAVAAKKAKPVKAVEKKAKKAEKEAPRKGTKPKAGKK